MILSDSEFYDILQDKTAPYEYDLFVDGKNLKLKDRDFPLGIKYMEFEYIKNIIQYYELKSGFEIGTGLGISAAAAGLGFKKTKGKLITMDSFIEENKDHCLTYEFDSPKVFRSDLCKPSIEFLINKFKLNNTVYLETGWSPNDVPSTLKKHNVEKIDYVFIDGGHFEDQLLKDLEVLIPYLDKNFILLFHDCTIELITNKVHQFFITNFGRSIRMVLDRPQGDWLCSIISFD